MPGSYQNSREARIPSAPRPLAHARDSVTEPRPSCVISPANSVTEVGAMTTRLNSLFVNSNRAWLNNCRFAVGTRKEHVMALRDLAEKEIYISLADDSMGFQYRVRRFGLTGRRRFVATSSKIQIPVRLEKPAGADSPQKHPR